MNQEKIRQKIAKQYKDKILQLEEENRELKRFFIENKELQNKNQKLQTLVEKQNEAIQRLLNYCNISPDTYSELKTPKDVVIVQDAYYDMKLHYYCPNCHTRLGERTFPEQFISYLSGRRDECCPECGQKLHWILM